MTSRTIALIGVCSMLGVPAVYAGNVTGVSVAPRTIVAGHPVSVTVTGTDPCGAAHVIYGDGDAITYAITGLPATQTHVYQKAGSYTITARGMGNCAGEATTSLTVSDPPPPPAPAEPAASIKAVEMLPRPARVQEPVAIVTRGSGTCSYEVHFGDGTAEQVRARLPEETHHTYTKTGRYTVIVKPHPPCVGKFTEVLQVVDAAEEPDRITHVVATPEVGVAGEPVVVSVHGTGPCAYDIYYGDGSAQDADGTLPQHTRHVYERSGTYAVVVKAQPPCSGKITKLVRVTADSRPRMTQISVSPTPAAVGRPVFITIEGAGTCEFRIDYGDGDWDSRSMKLPATLRHVYAAANFYAVVAVPVGGSCAGSERVRLEVR